MQSLWQKYLSEIVALQSRAKNIENSLKLNQILEMELSPGKYVYKIQAAEDARRLYAKALRLCKLLSGSLPGPTPIDLEKLQDSIATGLRRVEDITKILDHKAKKWGLESNQNDKFIDVNEASDEFLDGLKAEVKKSLKALADIVDYMEGPTLLKIRKELNKITNY